MFVPIKQGSHPEGLGSSLSWHGLIPHLNKIFNVQPGETIKGIEVTSSGLLVYFERR